MKPLTRKAASAVILAALMAGGALAQAGALLPPVRHSGPVEYLSGGIGADESAAIQSASRPAPAAMPVAATSRFRRSACGRFPSATAWISSVTVCMACSRALALQGLLLSVSSQRNICLEDWPAFTFTCLCCAWPARVASTA